MTEKGQDKTWVWHVSPRHRSSESPIMTLRTDHTTTTSSLGHELRDAASQYSMWQSRIRKRECDPRKRVDLIAHEDPPRHHVNERIKRECR